ncbi:MAG: PAS domain S-box protein [Pseudomonadota bacterium]
MYCLPPHAELERLEALKSFAILDTPEEAAFDRITQLAAHLFGAPIALISLVDEERQWFKSAYGLDARETPRDQAFCAHALALTPGEVLVVQDATADARFASNPLVLGPPDIRFYAGALLSDYDGHSLGTLCVIDSKPRGPLSDSELHQLRSLAQMVVDHLEARRTRRRLEEQEALVRQLNQTLEVRVEGRTRELEDERLRLAANEARLRDLVANAHQAIVLMDAQGRIEEWNRDAELTFGWTAAEVVGRSVAEVLIPEGQRDAHTAGLQRFLIQGASTVVGQRIEVAALHRDGREIPIELAISASQSVDGWRFTALMHDITERRAQNELFETAFHHAPIGYALVNLEGQFEKVNDALAALVGYAPAELQALTFQQITHADDLDRDLELLQQLVAGEIPAYQMDKRYIRQDGRVVWVNLSVSMVRDRDGTPKRFIAQVQDLTARMEAEARYKLMAENARDMIVTSDRRGKTTFVSAGCRAITGWTPAEAVGRDTEEFVHPEDMALIRDAFAKTARGEGGERIRWRGWNRAETRWVWLESSPSILADSDDFCFVDVVRDITGQVAQEQALAAARVEAEAAARAKAEFLANMSHEIRTPLTAVIGFGSLLSQRDDLSPDSRVFADRILTGANALLSVVNGILDFSKLEAGEMEITPRATDARLMAQEILGLFQPQADAKGLTLDLALEEDMPASVMVDPQALRQVLFNLIGNAVKFTEEGGVTLRVAHRKDRLMAAVEDTGAGMTLEQQARLFQRFSQVDGSSTRRHGGTGLGLAICKGLVEAMGGQIGVRSLSGRGSTFHFDIGAPAAATAAWSEAVSGYNIEGVRVLITDDNATNRELARAMLEALGAEVQEAADGLEAVEMAQACPFDVILMDVRMPRLDGPSAVARIREERGPNRFIPILSFSAGEAHEVSPEGFDGAVAKPVTPVALLMAIGGVLDDAQDYAEEQDGAFG